jgi:hypothetical protein
MLQTIKKWFADLFKTEEDLGKVPGFPIIADAYQREGGMTMYEDAVFIADFGTFKRGERYSVLFINADECEVYARLQIGHGTYGFKSQVYLCTPTEEDFDV